MAVYKVTGPDGHLYEFNGPEGAADETVYGYAKQLYDTRQAELKAKQNKGTAGDIVTALKQGVAQIPGTVAGLADIPYEAITGQNVVSQAGDKLATATGIHPTEYSKGLEEEKSAKYQAAQAEVNALWEANKQGADNYGEIAKFYATHPALTATNVAESAPSMIAGGVGARALKGVGALSAVTRGAIGEGAVSAGQINQQLGDEGGGSRQKALAALGAGVGTGLIAGASGKLATRLGIIDPETFLAGRAKDFTQAELNQFEKAANRGITARLGLGALQEGLLQELPQSAQEQMFQNWGGGKPIMEGVARNAIEGALAGSVMGGGFNAIAGNPAKEQLKAQQDAQAAAAQEQLAQEHRQATGVMEQQPLLTQEQAPEPQGPINAPTTNMETTYNAAGEASQTPVPVQDITYDKKGNPVYPRISAEPVPEGQEDLFTGKGKPSPAALASVETARMQGLPAQIAQLAATPEGRAELSANRKMYFPDLTTKERNAKIVEIQRAGVAPVVEAPVAEGTLTPALLKEYKIPKSVASVVENKHLSDPMTFQYLATVANTQSNTGTGIKVSKLLEAFPHYNPEIQQPDLFGVPNAPQAQATETPAPSQTDLFGVPEDNIQPPANEPPVEPSVVEPVQPNETPIESTPEPVGGGVGLSGQPVIGGAGQPATSVPTQPSPLAKQAAAALKKEPVATAWSYMSDTPFAKLSKIGKDRVRDAHTDGYLTQEEADDIMLRERGNTQTEAANAAVNPEEKWTNIGGKNKMQVREHFDQGEPMFTAYAKDKEGEMIHGESFDNLEQAKAWAKLNKDKPEKQWVHPEPEAPAPANINPALPLRNKSDYQEYLEKRSHEVQALIDSLSPAISKEQARSEIKEAIAKWKKRAESGEQGRYSEGEIEQTFGYFTDDPLAYADVIPLSDKVVDALNPYSNKLENALNELAEIKAEINAAEEQRNKLITGQYNTVIDNLLRTELNKKDEFLFRSIANGNTGNVLAWIGKNGFRGADQLVAKLLLKGNIMPKIEFGYASEHGVGLYVAEADKVIIDAGYYLQDHINTGDMIKTILHEIIHSATVNKLSKAMYIDKLNELASDELTKADKEYLASDEYATAKNIMRVFEWLRANHPKIFHPAMHYGATNPLEMMAEVFVNPRFYESLSDITLPANLVSRQPIKGILWFVRAIKRLVGLDAAHDSAITTIMSDTLALTKQREFENRVLKATPEETTGRRLHYNKYEHYTGDENINPAQISPAAQAQAQQAINAMSGTLAASGPKVHVTPTQVAQNIATTMVKNPTGAFGMIENMANKIRTTAVDKAAHLSASIQDHNDGAFRDINGHLRQDMGLSAANNMQNYINAIYTHGGIEILADKAIRVKTEKHSIDGVFRAGQKLAERIGVEDARKLITGAFYHYRAEAILKLPRAEWPKNWLADPRMIPTPAQIKAGMDAFKQFPELEKMRTEFIGSKNQMVKFLFDAGFLSKVKFDAFLADDSYAPWLRLKEYSDKIPGLGNMGRMVDLSQMKALVGGTEEVNDMLENMAQIIGWFARSGIANHTANQALDSMVTMNSAKKFKVRPTTGDPSHTVMTYVEGKPTFWQVDNPYDLAAFQTVKGLNSAAMRNIGRALGTLRAGIVLFPAFPLRQVIMDSQRAFIESGVEHPWPMMGKILKTFISGEAYKASSKDIETLRKYGVVGGVDFNAHDTTRGRAKQFGLTEPGNSLTDKWMRSPVYKALHTFAYSADLAVRLGIFRQTMEETGDEVLAATRAREIINFQKSGTSELMHTLKQTIPFLGAYLQGMDVNYRGMIGRGNSMKSRKAAAAAYWGNMAMYSGLVVAYTMCMSGDDEYEDQKGFITDRNFLIPGVGLLPVPTDVGFLGKVIPERITDYILQNGTDNPESAVRLRSGILQAAAAGFLPPMAVYGVTPAVELMLNRSFFSDMPIVGQYYQGLEKSQQFSPSTSEFAKSIGDITGQSPLQIDYIFNAIGGTSAGAILQLADVMAGNGKMASDKYPIISTFQMKTVGGRYAEEYYAVRDLTEKAYKTQQAMAERGDFEGREEFLARPEIQARLSARPGIESIHTVLNNVQHQRKLIEGSDLSPQAKRDAVNELLATVEANLKDAGIRQTRANIE